MIYKVSFIKIGPHINYFSLVKRCFNKGHFAEHVPKLQSNNVDSWMSLIAKKWALSALKKLKLLFMEQIMITAEMHDVTVKLTHVN